MTQNIGTCAEVVTSCVMEDRLYRPDLARIASVLWPLYQIAQVGTLDGSPLLQPGYRPNGTGFRVWAMTDNGGELMVCLVNHEDYRAIPYEEYRLPVDEGTLAYRVAMAIRGEPIDWTLRCPELIDEARSVGAVAP